MIITKARRPFLLLLLPGIFLLSFATSITLNLLRHDARLVDEPLHSTIEAFGGMAAVSMALLLLQLDRDSWREKGHYFFLSMGFFTMGILDTCHAVSTFGNGFILLRSLASLFSGVWFALVWLSELRRRRSIADAAPWLTILLSVVLGLLILTYRQYFPPMVFEGKFTPFAIAINLTAGALTTVSAGYFFLQFLRTSSVDSYLFTCMLLLLGLSAFEFPISVAWNDEWWFWHIQRIVAYAVVFYYVLRTFLRVSTLLRESNELLEQRIADRTVELSIEVAERQRYGSERDQVIAELQEALDQIKTLTGLLPTCASCKKIKDADGNWVQMESYIQNHSSARFSHGICPPCAQKLYPDVYDKLFKTP